jgi:hypothetical protein
LAGLPKGLAQDYFFFPGSMAISLPNNPAFAS